ncbi:MAG: N-acetyl-gamma-glutamyl-phosphate reductase [Archaeoglobi archaeon]|nr:N-acetyl-gamma-glutamyl-phosphate reductase [Candidatus Mnemosynella bozhongmuii]MDI3503006.1 N-acetyl-gamma-glutamyl-phosphate reductase [Archaeoglobi archaeon]MDK2782251.1 N-acetyl-gamma-glutamyl-phosphate reductase [Archaeoglobi archaeon]
MLKVGVIGASGYIGIELIRLLLRHPEAELRVITSRRFKDRKLSEVYPAFKGLTDLRFSDPDLKELSELDVVFTSVPHGKAMEYVPELREIGLRVIDLSADYRLPKEVYEKVYGIEHRGYLEAVYGLPEIHPEVRKAELVANPGCYPTGAILSVAPLVKKGVVREIIFDSKSGISGAGNEPSERSHYPNLAENIIAYGITRHRHRAEMIHELGRFGDVKIHFTPHVIPSIRGILTTAHVLLKEPLSEEEIKEAYERMYGDCFFIRFVRLPTLNSVRGSNFCDIGWELDEESQRVVVLSAIDNLVKGGAGQAVQNMNLMFGIDEKAGLWNPPLYP